LTPLFTPTGSKASLREEKVPKSKAAEAAAEIYG
jgi:hypothetical protein